MPFGVVLLKEELGILFLNVVDKWNNNSWIRAFIYSLPVFLLKEIFMPAIFPTYRPPKHRPDLPLITRSNVVLVVYLFSPNFPRYPDPPVPARLYPSLITPQNLIPLLVRPVLMLFGPFLPLLAILVRKGALLAFNVSAVPFLFESCADYLLSVIKTKNREDFRPRGFAVVLRGYGPLN